MTIYLTQDNFKVTNQYFSFQCVLFLPLFDLEKHDFFRFSLFFTSEFEALFAWLPCINDLLKDMPLAGHLYRVTMQKVLQNLR